MKLSLALFASFCCSAVQSFAVLPSARVTTNTRLSLMTPEETETLMKAAEDCVGSECSIDDVDTLIDALHEQQKELYSRVEEIKQTIEALENINQADDRKVDEVRETVRAIFRVFQLGDKASGNDYPALSKPTGYSGEVGDGPTTAYDALSPKKWKP